MTDPFRNVDAKLSLAEKRLVDLKSAGHVWAKANPAHVTHKHDPKTGWHVLRGDPLPEAPSEWAGLLGECLYDLRAALNQTVELLIRANQQTSQRTNQWPIVTKVEDAHLLAPQLLGVHPDPAAIIKKTQPYLRPNRLKPEPLEILAGLTNTDKHVEADAVAVLAAPWNERWIKLVVGQPITIYERNVLVGEGTTVSDTDLLSMRVVPPNAVLHMEMQPVPIEIAFSGGALPVRGIGDLIRIVRAVLSPLRPFVTAPPPAA
jgi:hypothetical protein